MIGQTLSHYRILDRIGAGGMGVVYRARDEHLKRDVALKILPTGTLAEDASRQQFRREAQALSKLNHPNIATIFDFDTQAGTDFLVMEFVAGETLSDRIQAGALPDKEIARLGEQMAEGLAAAHKEGLLHRDIKPANLRVTPEGRLKILDFGLAKLRSTPGGTTMTESLHDVGLVAGTLPYMAPEQLQGQRLDERVDLHAAGAVLYEMACGRRAFPQETPTALAGAILAQAPASPREVNAKLSADLERIILKCLEKNPDDRYQSARELAVDLRHAANPTGTPRMYHTGSMPRRAPIAVIAGVAAALLAVALVIMLNVGGVRERVRHGRSLEITPALAVLPLVNLSGDPEGEYFSDGMTDELITRLGQVSALRVIARSSVMQFKGTRKSLGEIGKALNVRMVVEGSVARARDRVRISAHLVDVKTGRTLWTESYERDYANVLGVQSEVAQSVVRRLEVRLSPRERGRLARAPKVNPKAHEAYLRGRAAYHMGGAENHRKAIDYFRTATAIDPEFADAWVGLAYACQWGGVLGIFSSEEATQESRRAATRALDLDPENAAARVPLASVQYSFDMDATAAERTYRESLALNPNDADARAEYGLLLVSIGRTDEAIAEISQARAIDPLSPLFAAFSLFPLFEGHRFREAASAAEELLVTNANSWHIRMIHGQALLFLGKHAEAIAEIQRAMDLDPGNTGPLGWLGFAYGVAGRPVEARQVLRRLEDLAKSQYVNPYLFAIQHAGVGEKAEAIRWLEKAADSGSGEIVFVRVDPALDSLRNEPQFKALLKRIGARG